MDYTNLLTIIFWVFGSLSGLYLYFENKELKKDDAEKEYRIWSSELERIDNEHEIKNKLPAVDFVDYIKNENNFLTERTKILAKIDFYKKKKNHSILFWFFKKKDKN